ncbi:anthranilate synthase component I family protein [Nibrella viscosa]|uniref:Anthranilate synthase component I family protein n=1 Tax=Nibrella viscosa TaxID=1084524 RepID=A0ABP8JW17_9BACT
MNDLNAQQYLFKASKTWWRQALAWSAEHVDTITLFNNNGIGYPHGPFPNRLAMGARRIIQFSGFDDLQTLYQAHREQPGWLIGYLSYDLKNQLEAVSSRHHDTVGFPPIFFYEPQYLLDFTEAGVYIYGDDADQLYQQISQFPIPAAGRPPKPVTIRNRVAPETYLATVKQIQEHIVAGDVYELNYCQEFFAEAVHLDPTAIYLALNERSPMPFSVFMKLHDKYLLCASPERFLRKTGDLLVSQPIKGTIRRGKSTEVDEQLRQALRHNEKEQAENLMIVDLVRNDLARSARTGTVRVDELFGIYTFRQVHQMISTVSARLHPDLTFADAIRHAFPMGSMTGAPKIRAMELIDQYEASRRGLYSGAVGYISPEGDFDFNVVIRSLLYNAGSRYASFSVGSAITYDADPEQEYQECQLKAQALREVLTGIV